MSRQRKLKIYFNSFKEKKQERFFFKSAKLYERNMSFKGCGLILPSTLLFIQSVRLGDDIVYNRPKIHTEIKFSKLVTEQPKDLDRNILKIIIKTFEC